MEILTTPPGQFDALPDFGYESATTDIGDGLAVHHVEAGEGPTVLLMHGQPTWSYLYRGMIGPLVEHGCRIVAPDLIGFGRSAKPREMSDHTYERHVSWMSAWLESVDLDGVTLFAQDWGGLIGLRLLAAQPDRFARLVVANTGLPSGHQRMPEAFHRWQEFVRTTPDFDCGRIVQGGTLRTLSDEEVAAYNAPFPNDAFRAGPRVMPSLVPTSPDDPSAEPNRAAWAVLSRWGRPTLTLFSDSDPITAGGERVFQSKMPGASGQPHRTIEAAGHFLQEDAGPLLADTMAAWMR
jgi:haloalkane dehalogenase